MAEHHDQRVALAPRQAELGEVDLRLMAGRRLEPHERLGLRPGPDAGDIVTHLGDPARVAGGADLLEQPHRGELGVGRQPGRDDPGKGIELRGPRRILARRRGLDVAPELAGRDPVMHHAAADAEALGNGRLGQAIIEQMLK
ncbi:MAG: hypothetical protein JWO05_3922 [Gemmatimonadetes bacterium]|nr:hypothetical protein [Gemmatimonadota bacterium]